MAETLDGSTLVDPPSDHESDMMIDPFLLADGDNSDNEDNASGHGEDDDSDISRPVSPPALVQPVTTAIMVMPAQDDTVASQEPTKGRKKPQDSEIPTWLKYKKAGEMQAMLKQLRSEQEAANVDSKELVATGVAPAAEYQRRIMRKEVSFNRAKVSSKGNNYFSSTKCSIGALG